MSDFKIWVHVYLDSSNNVFAPRENLGPHYNRRRYGQSNVEKGKRYYENRKKIGLFLNHHYDGEIIRDDDDYVIYKFEQSTLPNELGHCVASVFMSVSIDETDVVNAVDDAIAAVVE